MDTPTKQTVLAGVTALAKDGKLTLGELQTAFYKGAPAGQSRTRSLSSALYVVGTIIVSVSICLLIGQNWEQLNSFSRIAVTLGLGVLLYAAAWWRLTKQPQVNDDLLGSSLLTIASVATAVGMGVAVTEAGGDLNQPGTAAVLGLLVCALYGGLYLLFNRSLVFAVGVVAVGLGTYYAAVEWLFQDRTKPELLYQCSSIGAGVLLGFAGWAMSTRAVLSRLTAVLYQLGTLFVLTSCFWLTFEESWSPHNSLTFDLLFPVVLALAVWLSVQVNSRGILGLAALFLTAYIFEISLEYFSDYLGGTLALTFAGVFVLLLAYGATRFAKRYIEK